MQFQVYLVIKATRILLLKFYQWNTGKT